MKHVKLFESFINEARLSSRDRKKLQEFAEEVADEIYWEYEDDFDSKSRDLDPEEYTADAMLEYLLDHIEMNDMTVDELVDEWNWREMTYELGLA
ncbi:MAG: hypothetical protein HKN86_03595 [Acidimicrobiia bacterium]|nr:hypothetical protein [Acidimicrobiia bacterium]